MIKQDEIDLMNLAIEKGGGPCCLIDEIKTKRQYFILDKWAGKGIWECGVTIRSGWLKDWADKEKGLWVTIRRNYIQEHQAELERQKHETP